MAIKSFEFLNTPLISTNPANGFIVDYMQITVDVPDGATFIHTSNVTQIIANGKYYDGMMGQLENWTATGLDSSYLVAGNVFAIEGNYLKTIPNSTAKLSFNWNYGFGGGTGAFMGPYLSADAYDPANDWNRITLSSGYIALDTASSLSPTGTIVTKILRLDNGKKRSVDLTQDTLKMTTFTVDGYARYNGSTSGYVDLKAPTTVGSSGSSTILAQQLSTPNSAYFWWDGGPTYAPQGQTFSLASSATLDKISLYLFKGETITSGTISVSLYATSGGLPTGVALATSASMNATLLTNSTAEYEFAFTPGVSIAASTTYAFVVEAAGMAGSMGMGFPGVYVSLDYAGTYASGEALYWNGSAWATTGTSDLAFKLAESGPSEPSSWTFTLPTNDGDVNQFLQTNGSGVTSWTTIPTPTLQSVYEAGNTIATSVGEGDIAITGTQKLSITKLDSSDAFFAGIDSNSRLVINYQGAIDQVSNHGSIPSGSFRNMGGPVLRLQGNNSYYVDINPGLPSASYSLTLPADDGDVDQFLQTNGSGTLTWAAAAKLDLSNLNSTAINQSLVPDSSADQDVGSSSLQWRDVFASSGLKVATTGGVENIAAASTLNIGSAGNTSELNLGTGSGTNTINIGTGTGTTTINLGGAGDTVNIAGTLTYVNTTNLEVTDKLVVLNKGGAAASGNASGIAIQENGVIEGYAYVGNTRASWDFVAPAGNSPSVLLQNFITLGGVSQGILTSHTRNNNLYIGGDFFFIAKASEVKITHGLFINSSTSAFASGIDSMLFNGTVRDATVVGDFIYVGGNFTVYNGIARTRIAKISLITGQLDPTFDATTGFDGEVLGITADSAGNLYVTGNFTTYKGTARQYIAKINGTTAALDTTFNTASGFNSTAYKTIINNSNELFACGQFTSYKGTTRQYIAKLNATTGALDTTFDSASGFNAQTRNLAFDSNGDVIVSGFFTSYNATTRQYIAKVHRSTAALDTTFDTASGFNNWVTGMAVDNSFNIYTTGWFSSYKGTARSYVAKINGTTGALDTTFNSASGFNSYTQGVCVDSTNNALYVGGGAGGGFTAYKGTTRQRLAKLNATTAALDTTFDTSTGFTDTYPQSVEVNVLAMASSNLFAGGNILSYKSVNTIYARRSIAKINLSTQQIDTTFDTSTGFGIGESVYSITSDSSNNLYVAGAFSTYKGTARQYIAKINGTTAALDTTFNTASGFNSQTVSVILDNASSSLYVSGSFTTYQGTARQYIAKINATTATLDTTFDTAIGFSAGDYGYTSTAQTVLDTSGTSLFVVGNFRNYKGITLAHIAKLDATTGALDATFNATTGFNTRAQSIVRDSSNNLYVVGDFTNYKGTARQYIAKINGTTAALDTTFNTASGLDSAAYTAVLDESSSKLYVGGGFTTYKGVTRPQLIKIDTSTAAIDASFNTTSSFSPFPVNIRTISSPDLYGTRFIGGYFSAYKNTAASNLVRIYDTTAQVASGWVANPTGTFRLTPDANYVSALNTAALSTNRTYTLPNASGTLLVGTSGILALANGGTNKALTASSGTIIYSDADSLELSIVGSAGQPLLSGGAGTPTWFTSSGIVKATSGILSAANTISLTTEVTNALPLANGGTNKNLTASAGAVVYSDADSFELTSVGTSGQVLKSNGSSAPAFADPDKLYVTLTNSSGSNIGAGNVVASSQATANTIIRADATSLDTCEAVIGIAVAAIPNGSSGLIQISGRCTTIARDGAFDIGRTVYVSENVGKATKTAPSSSGSVIYSLGIADSTTSVLLRPSLRAVNSGTPLPNPPFVAVSLNDELGGLTTYLRGYASEFRNPSFYPYTLDGDQYFINDGGSDMYDGGNYTFPWFISGADYSTYTYNPNSGSQLSYTNTSPATVDTSFRYVSLGYEQQSWGQVPTLTTVHPLTLLGTRNTVGTPIGFQKAGNSGADGGGTLASGYIYENADIDGFTVYAWMRQTYNAYDPSHCDLYILIGHPAWESVFGTVSAYAHPVTFGGNGGYLYTSGPAVQNILAIATLLSKNSGVLVTNAECQTVVQNYINRIKLYFNL